jgi:hypothetical protein
MEVSSQRDAPAALTPRKKSPVPIELEAEWAPEPVWVFWKIEIPLSPPGIPGCSSLSLVSVSSEISLLFLWYLPKFNTDF